MAEAHSLRGNGLASSANKISLQLTNVTMLEAVTALRDKGIYIQFERERLDDVTIDRSRPVADSRNRFSISLLDEQPVDRVLTALTNAASNYDWIPLTE